MAIYAVVAASVQGVGRMQDLGSGDGETALAEVFAERGAAWMSFVLFVCALLGVSAVGMTNLIGQSRVFFSIAKHGLFFDVFKKMDPTTKVPVYGIWISAVPISIAAFCMNLKSLTILISLGNLLTYAFIDTAVIALRIQNSSESGKMSVLGKVCPWTFFAFSMLSATAIQGEWSAPV